MVDPLVSASNILKLGEADLGDDGTELPGRRGDSVRGGSVASGEYFSRNDEGRGVGAEILEEVGQAVEEDEGAVRVTEDSVVTEAHDDEDDGEEDETHELDGLAAPDVNEEEGNPVARNETSGGEAAAVGS